MKIKILLKVAPLLYNLLFSFFLDDPVGVIAETDHLFIQHIHTYSVSNIYPVIKTSERSDKGKSWKKSQHGGCEEISGYIPSLV